MGGSKGLWLSAPLVAALWLPSCIFGGQTGEDSADEPASAGGGPTCQTARVLGYDQMSSQGVSAAELIDTLGGELVASITEPSAGFWSSIGVSSPPLTPYDLSITIEYFGGAVVDNECTRQLSVEVVVTIRVADGVLERSGVARLEGEYQQARLEVALPAPPSGDASSETVSLVLDLSPLQGSGELRSDGSSGDVLTFIAARP